MTTRWFAIVCKVDHPDGIAAGEVYSYSTSQPASLDDARFDVVDLGEHAGHIDFGSKRWNKVTRQLEAFVPPADSADALLDKPSWNAQDQQDAMREILRRLKGRPA